MVVIAVDPSGTVPRRLINKSEGQYESQHNTKPRAWEEKLTLVGNVILVVVFLLGGWFNFEVQLLVFLLAFGLGLDVWLLLVAMSRGVNVVIIVGCGLALSTTLACRGSGSLGFGWSLCGSATTCAGPEESLRFFLQLVKFLAVISKH